MNKDNFIEENKLIFKKYKPIKKIGQGNFGNLYSVLRLKDKHLFALKAEKLTSKVKMLESEAYYLFTLQGFGIPKFISYGHHKNYNILIEELLDKSLYEIFLRNDKKTNLIDICLIGIQLIDRFEWIHAKDIVYRDIKPENFLIGINDPNVIYVVDFGFCKKYRSSKTGKHILPKNTGKFNGTLRYASPHTIKGKEHSRRDDLISLGYMLIYMYKKDLPWDLYMSRYNANIYLKLIRLKENDGEGKLFNNLPGQLIEYIKYTRNLKFEQNPDYSYLRSLFVKIIFNMKLDYRILTFSWIQPNNKIFFGVPRNSFIRENTPHKRKYKNILENESSINRNVSQDNIRSNNIFKPIHSTEISIITDVPKIKNNKVFKLKPKGKIIKEKEINNKNLKIIKFENGLKSKNRNNIIRLNPYISNFKEQNDNKFIINHYNRKIDDQNINDHLIYKKQAIINKKKPFNFANSYVSRNIKNEEINNVNETTIVKDYSQYTIKNYNYKPLFKNIIISPNYDFKLNTENNSKIENLKRININKNINLLNNKNKCHSDLNDQIIINKQKNYYNFNQNNNNKQFINNNYKRNYKSPSSIRQICQNNIDNTKKINMNNNYNINNIKDMKIIHISPLQK